MKATVWLWLLPLVATTPAFAQSPGEQDPFGDAEHIEVLTDDDFAEMNTPDTVPAPGAAAVVGYFHAAAVHLPIAWVLLLLLIEIAALFDRRPWHGMSWPVALLSAASFLPAMATGIARAQSLTMPEAEMGDIILHRNVMFVAFAVMLVAILVRWRTGQMPQGARRRIYLGCVIVTAVLTTLGGHLGGSLVYGPLPL